MNHHPQYNYKALDPDLDEYLSEYKNQTPLESDHYADGESEAQWLVDAGFPQLTRAFEQGREQSTSELVPILARLSKHHAEAVKLRVKALNQTVRGRTRSRNTRKKPDIRDVFRDVETCSTGSRSRSATPDSLDSLPDQDQWNNSTNQIPSFVSIFDNTSPTTINRGKQNLRRTPSAPLRGSAELFRGSHIRCDIPCFTADGIELLNFQRLGTIHIPRIRSGSDPSCTIGIRKGNQIISSSTTRSHNNLYLDNETSSNSSASSSPSPSNSPPRNSNLMNTFHKKNTSTPYRTTMNDAPISFESMIRETEKSSDGSECETIDEVSCDINSVPEGDLKKLQPVLWLEIAAIFDKHHISLDRRKPFKRKRKEEGNVFGVSLNALVRRDQQVTGEDTSLVPLVLQGMMHELIARGAKEEGILRVAGHKQKTETLYQEIEHSFYSKPEKVEPLLKRAGVHDLSALLKRWLRELPQPLLAIDLVHLFYQTHALPSSDQVRAISMLCLLLPHENRNTMRELLNFFKLVVDLQSFNKMSIHNVATITAPSFFPPRFVHPTDKNDIPAQVRMAAQCCHLTNVLIAQNENLWKVPQRLIDEAKKISKNGNNKRQPARKTRSATQSTSDTNNVHRLVI
ncbi:unnamed protein product [Chironomus riparius]|uniref:Rho-GAP domain-containing protein n=1 Tax=Chironomus riparius TaxID=315576 RepID=A0A9N9RKU8_9DIPT|nr:unnamed protein product [Chironomus riparius]